MKKLIQSFSDLRLAIFLLLLIAIASSLGSMIEQEKEPSFYLKTYPQLIFGQTLGRYFLVFEFDHLYSSPWFFFLLFVFGLCLLCCTVSTQFPALTYARRYYFYTSSTSFKKLRQQVILPLVKTQKLCHQLNDQTYLLFQQEEGLYGYKGLVGRISPIFVHLSILLILLGSVISATEGFQAQEFIPTSEIFHIQNIIKRGALSTLSRSAFRINDFWVQYGPNSFPQQFYTNLSKLDGRGLEVDHQTLSVNNPLQTQGMTIYQTDWGISGLRVQSRPYGQVWQLPVYRLGKPSQKLWVSWYPTMKSEPGCFFLIKNRESKAEIYDSTLKYLGNIYRGPGSSRDTTSSLRLVGLIFSTGLQIKTDPGIGPIYLGFGFLILSSFVSYISFTELWALSTEKRLQVGGKTNRAKLQFQKQFQKLTRLL